MGSAGKFRGDPSEESHAGDDGIALGVAQAAEGGTHPIGIEEGALRPETEPGLAQAELDPAGVGCALRPGDETEAVEPGELERDGGGSNPHAPGELADRGGLDGIELIQHAGEVIAHRTAAPPGPGEIAAPTGDVDSGIGGEDGVHGIVEHAGKWR